MQISKFVFFIFCVAISTDPVIATEYSPYYRYGYLKTESQIKNQNTENNVAYNQLGLAIDSGGTGGSLGLQYFSDPEISYVDNDLSVKAESKTYLISPEAYIQFGLFGLGIKPYVLAKYGYEDITLNIVKDGQKVDLSTLQSIGPFFGYGFLLEYQLGPIIIGLGSSQFDFTKGTSISGTKLSKRYVNETYLSISMNANKSRASGVGHESGISKNIDPCKVFNAC